MKAHRGALEDLKTRGCRFDEELDPDPRQSERSDPDPHQSENLDPIPPRSEKPDLDPHQYDADPQY